MSEDVVVEGTGDTVGEAKWAALRALESMIPELDRDAVSFEVVSEDERGLLGVGYSPARVTATAPPPAPSRRPAAGGGAAADLARELVERVVEAVGASCVAHVRRSEESVVVTLTGPDVGLLIGRHGQTLDAIQYLANAIASRLEPEDRPRIVVDAAGYRSRRAEALHRLAGQAADRAAEQRGPVTLEAMSSVERRVVHEFLSGDPRVETASEGSEPHRYVVVVPRHPAD